MKAVFYRPRTSKPLNGYLCGECYLERNKEVGDFRLIITKRALDEINSFKNKASKGLRPEGLRPEEASCSKLKGVIQPT